MASQPKAGHLLPPCGRPPLIFTLLCKLIYLLIYLRAAGGSSIDSGLLRKSARLKAWRLTDIRSKRGSLFHMRFIGFKGCGAIKRRATMK